MAKHFAPDVEFPDDWGTGKDEGAGAVAPAHVKSASHLKAAVPTTATDEPEHEGVGSVLFVIALSVVLALVLRAFVIGAYVVPSGSMLETIQEGDMLLGEKVSLVFAEPKAGDIVTFESPLDGQTLIKRVVATGGQTIDLIDGIVYVDGEALVEDIYTLGKPTYSESDLSGSANIIYPYTIPEGYLWVMGDNRTNSKDSRYFGPVSVTSVTSRALFIYWPLSDIGLL